MVLKNGTPGNDVLLGTEGADSLFGLDGNDRLLGLGGSDRLFSGTGNDSINGGDGDDILRGNEGNDSLEGGKGSDRLFGGVGSDRLSGGDGNDILTGSTNAVGEIDTLTGGVGNDTYIITSTVDKIVEAANSGRDTVQSSVSYTLGSNLENLTLTGTREISGTGNDLNNIIVGNDQNNILNGLAGNDILEGGLGDDTLYGGDGDDILGSYYNYNYNSSYVLYGGDGNDTLLGGVRNDTLYGGAGDDILRGSYGANVLYGGAGNDTFELKEPGDKIVEAANSGIDTVVSSGSYTLGSNLENLTLTRTEFDPGNGIGNDLNNIIIGNSSDNILTGLAGNDNLNGGADNDELFGSSGGVGERDTLTGGTERDTFFLGNTTQVFYDDRNKATSGTGDYALITDLNKGEDVIKLNGRKTDYLLAASPAGLPVGTAIYLNKPSGEKDELIAIVQGSSGLSLDDNYFRFTADEVYLSALNGSNGFVIDGINADDRLGRLISTAGDINGDGFDDIIIGTTQFARDRDSYVVFGQAGDFDASFNLSALNGSNGFVINGINDRSTYSVSDAGDVNDDGFDDIIIGVPSRTSYVVFGQAGGFSANLNLSALNGSNGFKINGIDADDRLGYSVSNAGDVNGDGFNDLIIGAPSADPNGQSSAGESYVVFGQAGGFGASLNLSALNGSNGFKINGIDADDRLGYSVSNAGDVNGDGFDDLIIGANGATTNYEYSFGESYVVFGQAGGFDASLNLSALNGSNGFRINGISPGDRLGSSLSNAGDVNGDGFDDIIIGTNFASPGIEDPAGESYVVFGKEGGFDASLNLIALNGSNGFRITGSDAGDRAGYSLNEAGDVNGDGFDDLIIGAPGATANGQSFASESYVVFGKLGGFDASLNLFDINGSNGFVINGIDEYFSGDSVSSAGDINGDGFDDLIIGAFRADPNGQRDAGESYVLFGRDFTDKVTNAGTAGNDTLTGTANDDILIGGLGNDRLIGGKGIDVLIGGAGNDTLSFGAIDRRLDGGSGTDTLSMDTSGITLNLTSISNNKITQFELIDITGTGDNSLVFNRLDVLALSDTTNQLIIKGNAGDTVTSTMQGWIPGGSPITLDGNSYKQYTAGAATLLVDTDITRMIT